MAGLGINFIFNLLKDSAATAAHRSENYTSSGAKTGSIGVFIDYLILWVSKHVDTTNLGDDASRTPR